MGLVTALNSGLTGIMANQKQVEVTGNNISNVNTPGYSRQTAPLSPKGAADINGLLIGQGVNIESVNRAYDRFVSGQLIEKNDLLGKESAKSGPLSDLERVFKLDDDSLASDIERFFGSWHELSQNPSGSVERDRVMYEGQNLLASFEQVHDDLAANRQNINDTLKAKVNGINLKLNEIAELNENIKSRSAEGQQANSDLDRRDVLVKELSKTLGAQSYQTADNQIGLQLPGGVPLVQGKNAVEFQPHYEGDSLKFQVLSGDVTIAAENSNFGGEFGGLLEVRDSFIPEMSESLETLKYSLTTQVNARHEAGFGLDGKTGQAFFTRPTSYQSDFGTKDPQNQGFNTGTLTVTVDGNDTDVAIGAGQNSLNGIRDAINDSDAGVLASVVHDGTDYHLDLTPETKDASVAVADNLDTAETDWSLSGSIDGDGTYVTDGPYSDPDAANFGTGDITVTVDGTDTDVAIGAGQNSLNGIRDAINASGAGVNAVVTQDGTDYALELTPPEGAALDGVASGLTDPDDAADYGSTLADLSKIEGSDDTKVEVASGSSVAAAGGSRGDPGDNENALDIYSLSEEKAVEGEASFVDYYGRMASSVGTETKKNAMAKGGAEDTVTQLENMRDSVSGVSIEQEMINLTKFQKGFEASSRYVRTIDEMLGTILAMKR
ncbi:MAG: flagellar hook-associated protein FlgK [Thermodesulfobacteriota bacterium]